MFGILVTLWGIAVPIGMAWDDGARPKSLTEGLGAIAIALAISLVAMLITPMYAGMWAMGFGVGSVISLVIAPIKGYPALDIVFAVGAIGACGVCFLSSKLLERKNGASLRRSWSASRGAMAETPGLLISEGEIVGRDSSRPEGLGRGMVMAHADNDGPILFQSNGQFKSFERSWVHAVHIDVGTRSVLIEFTRSAPVAGISISVSNGSAVDWLALSPKEKPAS